MTRPRFNDTDRIVPGVLSQAFDRGRLIAQVFLIVQPGTVLVGIAGFSPAAGHSPAAASLVDRRPGGVSASSCCGWTARIRRGLPPHPRRTPPSQLQDRRVDRGEDPAPRRPKADTGTERHPWELLHVLSPGVSWVSEGVLHPNSTPRERMVQLTGCRLTRENATISAQGTSAAIVDWTSTCSAQTVEPFCSPR